MLTEIFFLQTIFIPWIRIHMEVYADPVPHYNQCEATSLTGTTGIFLSVVDPDPHGSGTFAWIRIRN